MIKKIFLIIFIIIIGINLYSVAPAYKFSNTGKLKTTQLTIEKGYSSPCVYDWNGDGLLDIISGSGEGPIYVYLNSGSSTEPKFTTGERLIFSDKYIKNSSPYIMSTNNKYSFAINDSDFNGDGKPDLLTSGGPDGDLYIFYNKNNYGTTPEFDKSTNFSLAQSGRFVQPWDFDSDGDLDILLGYSTSSTGRIILYTNTGTSAVPRFSSGYSVIQTNGVDFEFDTTVLFWYSYVTTDPGFFICKWDDNNKPDLLITYPTDTISYVNGVGSFKTKYIWLECKSTNGLNFEYKGEIKSQEGESINIAWKSSVFPAYWDNDSYLDIISGDYIGCIHKLLGTGDKQTMNINTIQIQADESDIDAIEGVQVILEDWNNDNLTDVILGNSNGLNYYFLNTGTSSQYEYKSSRLIKTTNNRTIIAEDYSYPNFFDWNLDGKKDLMLGTGWYGYVHMFVNIGTKEAPKFSFDRSHRIKAGGAELDSYYIGFQPGDLDNDGAIDLLYADGSGELYYCQGVVSNGSNVTNSDGDIKIKSAEVLKFNYGEIVNVGQYPSDPFVIDWEGDGDKDILVACEAQIHLLKDFTITNGKPIIGEKDLVYVDEGPIHGGQYAMLYMMDYNHDNWQDIFIANNSGKVYYWMGSTPRYVEEDAKNVLDSTNVYFYPNPVTEGDTVNLRYLVRDNSILTLDIYTYNGKLLLSEEISGKYDEDNIYQWDISNIKNGVYICKISALSYITGEINKVVKKIIILK